MLIHKKVVVAAVAVMGAFVLASCSSGETSDEQPETEVEETRDRDRERERDREQEENSDEQADRGDLTVTDTEPTDPGDMSGLEGLDGIDGFGDFEIPDFNQAVDLPADFPADDVPLVDGIIFQADEIGSGDFLMYSIAVNVDDRDTANVEAEATRLLTSAGFTPAEDSLTDLGGQIEGFSMKSFEGSGDVQRVLLTVTEMGTAGGTMVMYSVDSSTYDFDW